MVPKKQILIISFSDLKNDPRVYRQIEWLSSEHHVTTVGLGPSGIAVAQHLTISQDHNTRPFWHPRKLASRFQGVALLMARCYEKFYWTRQIIKRVVEQLKLIIHDPDLIIVNDIDPMPLVRTLFPKVKVLLDLHEYAPKEWEDKFYWRLFFAPYKQFLCEKYIPQTETFFTVCAGIADEYNKLVGKRPLVFTSAPAFIDQQPSDENPGRIRMIYHGVALSARRVENSIELMNYLDDRFELDLVLILVPGEEQYLKKLTDLGGKNSKIRFISKFPMLEISRCTNCYDIGLYIIPPTNFNYHHGFPNKFFEFIQARLAIAIGPSPEMAREVRKYGCGVVAQDFKPESLARELNKLTAEDIRRMKKQSHIAAQELNAEKNRHILFQAVEKCLKT